MKHTVVIEYEPLSADSPVLDPEAIGERVRKMTGNETVKVTTMVGSIICHHCGRITTPHQRG